MRLKAPLTQVFLPFSSMPLRPFFLPCVLAIEFRNWNSKHFLIDWEMTLTLFFHGFADLPRVQKYR
jgi:hypothetical protein